MSLLAKLKSMLSGPSSGPPGLGTSLSLVQLPTSGWNLKVDESDRRAWTNDEGDVMSLHFFDLKPDLPAGVAKTDELRSFYREQIVDAGGALVEADSIELSGIPGVCVIFKIPQDPTGMTYLGSYTLPFTDHSYVIKFQCPEMGITGARDAAVAAQEMEFDPDSGAPINWMQDPYEPHFESKLLRNPSDDDRWDSSFPDHPLSRLRRNLAEVRAKVVLADGLRRELPFETP